MFDLRINWFIINCRSKTVVDDLSLFYISILEPVMHFKMYKQLTILKCPKLALKLKYKKNHRLDNILALTTKFDYKSLWD